MSETTFSNDTATISKYAALELSAAAWHLHILPKNLVSGIKQAGIWPLSLEQMHSQLNTYSTGGLPIAYEIKDWLLAKTRFETTS
ncbi:hypothetical protein ACHHYP_20494 [Achlya hypogyna]|uniref:Uncharacterized protein n=1 Tax=Achlya hypogyna TaxID=1202772 RepID=A0A1V9YKT2_ACHHY|nr:hypothetical protein ACHHYP_20494 [Achlya hypogyna]